MQGIPTGLTTHPRYSLMFLMIVAIGLLNGTPLHAASAAEQGIQMHVNSQVQKALEAVDALDAAILGQDAKAFAAMLTQEVVVNSPGNEAILRDQILKNFNGGAIQYDSYVREIEYAAPHGADVIVMGWETVKPIGNSPGAGTTARRRFTDVWTPQDGTFRLRARQATVVSVK